MNNDQEKKLKLPTKAQEKLDSFLAASRIWGKEVEYLHPIDWQKFYLFIYHCHRYRVKISSSEIKKMLIDEKFSGQFAKYLADIFEHGRALLRASLKYR